MTMPNAPYRPIYDTDLSKSPAELIYDLRNQLTHLRGQLYDVYSGYPAYKDDLTPVEGLLTCAISYLYQVKQRMEQHVVEHQHGEKFFPRGIGSDSVPGCFVCGGDPGLYANLAAHVSNREAGERATAMFTHGARTHGARLDYRPSEPDWVQVKIGACPTHLPNLRHLYNLTATENVLTPAKVELARTGSLHGDV
jgi:hypothetical protein